MSHLITEDMHIRSGWSHDPSALHRQIEAARRAGLKRICLVEHHPPDAHTVARFVDEVAACRAALRGEMTVYSGVLSTYKNEAGDLDLPDLPLGLDYVFASDALLPVGNYHHAPFVIRQWLFKDRLAPIDLLVSLLHAMMGAMQRYPQVVISRPFYGLRATGLSEVNIPPAMYRILVDCAIEEGAIVEINERGQCPTFSMTRQLERQGVELVFGSEAIRPESIGRYQFAQHLLTQLLHAVIDNTWRSDT